eukprot:scaffold317799_cov23-Tisochrysis_lutea.AAC.2
MARAACFASARESWRRKRARAGANGTSTLFHGGRPAIVANILSEHQARKTETRRTLSPRNEEHSPRPPHAS